MHRLFYLLIAVVMLTSSVLLAQEPQESKVDRYIALYLDADSGNIIPGGFDGNGIFAGNEFEFGTSYRQNFSKAQWLFFDFTILSIFKQVGWYEDEKYIGLNGGQPYYGFMGGAYNIAPRARVALTAHGSGFGANGLDMYLSIDTRTLVVFALGYTFYFGGSGDLRIGSSVEFFANPIAFAPQGYTSGSSAPPAKKMHILDVFVLSLGYNINFAERWNYSTLIEARFGGLWNIGLSSITYNNSADAVGTFDQISAWEQNFLSGLDLRWDNIIGVTIDGLYLWTNLRLGVANLVGEGEFDTMVYDNITKQLVARKGSFSEKVDYSLALRAGIRYNFDISKP